MKLLKVFAVFAVLHLLGWIGAHVYQSNNPKEVLLVVDTSFSMKPHFPAMQSWIDQYETGSRYRRIVIGSDKAEFGDLTDLKSKESLFRTVFGRLTDDSLKRYEGSDAAEKILLSDGSIRPTGWDIVTF